MSGDTSPTKHGVLARIPPLNESRLSMHASPSRNPLRNPNYDQEVTMESYAPLIILNDVSTHYLAPKYTSRILPPIKTIIAAAAEGEKKEGEGQNNENGDEDDEDHSESNSQSGGSSSTNRRREEKKVDIFGDGDDKSKKKKKRCTRVQKILDHPYFQIFVNVLTIWALFSDDIRVIAAPAEADTAFSVLAIVIMGIFVVELVMNVVAVEDYLWSFTFLLDIVGIASMVFDITWIESMLSGNSKSLAKAGKGARVGARAGKIVRIVRLVRLVKFTKIADKDNKKALPKDLNKVFPKPSAPGEPKKSFTVSGSQNQLEINDNASVVSGTNRSTQSHAISLQDVFAGDNQNLLKESRVGKQLSTLTVKRVVIIVLLLVFLVPLFSTDYWNEPDREYNYMADDLKLQIVSGLNGTDVNTYVDSAVQQSNERYKPIIQFVTPNYTVTFTDPNTYRESDLEIANSSFEGTPYAGIYADVMVVLDKRPETTFEAELGIGRTLFISLALVLASIFFNKDVEDQAIAPIERMIEKVNKIAANPLVAKEEELIAEATAKENEIAQIENAIIKIGTLLALGFGDAGSGIIAQNIANGGDVNPMIKGQKKMAIFGFCDIRNFTDATEVLQEEVMMFVNSIGDIVHRIVDKYNGSANKNIGDAFLLVWKFPDEEVCHPTIHDLDVKNSKVVQNICDLAIISFLKIYARINKDLKMLAYRKHEKLNERIPNYKVKMGFGLHMGWAIEGAIGSEFKIDASYLSPNVNMASRLEAATKQYGVPLLISGSLYNKCSKPIRDIMRHIDRVTVKGSKQPIDFYTIDCNIDELPECTPKELTKKEIRKKRQASKLAIQQEYIDNEGRTADLLDTDKDLRVMVKDNGVGPFYETFQIAFKAYLKGDWSTTKRKLEECLTMRPGDGPSTNLYEFLRDNDFIAPEEWAGYRILTEK